MVFTLAENVRSLYNVGTIFRTAEGAGVSRIFLTGITGCPPHREIRKVALGAEENVSWTYEKESLQLVDRLKKEGVQIVVLETDEKSLPYDEVVFKLPVCLVIGNEYHGVSENLLDKADLLIKIPMHGQKVSLNVGVAYGIAVYQICKSTKQEGSFE